MKTIEQIISDIRVIADKLPQPYKDQLNMSCHELRFVIERKHSLLIDGKIPADQRCPFVEACELKQNCSKVEATPIMFSCGAARAFDLIRVTKMAKQFRN